MALKYIHTYNECSLFISKIAILAILTKKKKKFCKSIPNGLKGVNNMKPAKPNFCRSPVPAVDKFSM